MIIADFLAVGEENAQTGRELCDLLQIDKRVLQATIERERRNGTPICATCSTDRKAGYFLAGNKREMQDYCHSLQRRKNSIQRTLNACRKTIDTLPEEG